MPTARVPPPRRPAVVRASNLHVAWDMDLVLHGVDFAIPAGQAVALTGANGSGKSTTLRALLGTAPITRGGVELFGASVARPSAVDWKRVGYVPQRVSSGGGVSASAIEVVRSGLLGPRRWWAAPGDSRAAMGALERVGLAHRASSPMGILSGGQQQRVLIARALVRRPELLLLDEPLAGIDRESRQGLAGILTALSASGLTLVTVLHEMGELAPVVHRAVVLAEGRLVADRPAADLAPTQYDPADPVGHDPALGCEHEHVHGSTAPVVHHAPRLLDHDTWRDRP